MSLTEPPKLPQKRPEWPRWTKDEAGEKELKITAPLGLVVTVIIHLLFIWMITLIPVNIIEKEPRRNPPLEVEFLPPVQPMPEFVETNPVANQEVPEETDKISSQDQVAAQEEPDPTQDNDTPRVEGEELDSSKIVSGTTLADPAPPSPMMSEPTPQMPPTPEPQQAVEMETQPTPIEPQEQPEPNEQTETQEDTAEAEPQYLDQETSEADPGMDKADAVLVEEAPEAEEGFKAAVETGEAEVEVEETVAKTAQPEQAQDDRLEVYMEEVVVDPTEQSQSSSTPRPQARPRLNFVRTTSGPLKNEPRSTSRAGTISVDAKFDKFGAYLQRMIEAIDQQWQIMVHNSSTPMAELGSRVIVRYTINQQGEIINMEILHTSSSRAGTVICTEAIQSRAPFGVWTEEMNRTLGESQKITIRFYYR